MFPDRQAVADKLRALIAGGDDVRDEIADWAMRYVLDNDGERVTDSGAWTALMELTHADAPTIDRDWLYGDVDFRAWLAELTG